jgi:hypothetical protein
MRGPRPEQDAPSRQRQYRTAMRPNANLEFDHSSPHPPPVQSLLIDQQIASALPHAQ